MRYNQLLEGVRIGKKEIEETLKHSQDFQMGIEYEFLTPNPSKREQEADSFINQFNISHIDKVVIEHDGMMEIITKRMNIVDGLRHIKYFFESAKSFGITFPEMAGMHISISHKQANSKPFNYTKFIVLLSGDYLHSIFPERGYVSNISEEFRTMLSKKKPKNVKEVESIVNDSMHSASNSAMTTGSLHVGKKYITAKLSDYSKHDGRIELRFFGGKNYNTMYNDIRTQLLRSIYILSIALDDSMYRKEYLKQLGKLLTQSNDLDPEDAYDILNSKKVAPNKRNELEKIIANDAEFSYIYAKNVLKGRFEKGETTIATDAEYSIEYARDIIKGRFKEGEGNIITSPRYSLEYAVEVIKGRFKEGEDAISRDPITSYDYAGLIGSRFEKGEDVISESEPSIIFKYAMNIVKGRFKKGEEKIINDGGYLIAYARDVIKGRFEEAEEKIAESPTNSYLYAKDVIKERFKKGEKTIIDDGSRIVLYAENVIKGRFKEAEDKIKENPQYSVEYAERVIKGRFKEAEETIMQSSYQSYTYAATVIKGRLKEAEDIIMNDKEVAFHYLALVNTVDDTDTVIELMKKYLDDDDKYSTINILQNFINNDNLDIKAFKEFITYRYKDEPKQAKDIISMISDMYGL